MTIENGMGWIDLMKNNRGPIVAVIIFFALLFRLGVMFLGHNYDFESWVIVGKIVSEGGNVYAETPRYPYGPTFTLLQGLFYYVSTYFSNHIFIYRLLIVLTLSAFDILISFLLLKKYNLKIMALFLLNPVTIIITGYHNQIDNIALYFALLGAFSINSKDTFSRQDIISIFFLSLSLTIKHLLFMFPVWILFKDNFPRKKKLAYAIIPVFCFFISFTPYLEIGWNGILQNVLLYRANNNYPLLNLIFTQIIGISIQNSYQYLFFTSLFFLGYVLRKKTFEQLILYYLIGLVCFSSSIYNQYLSIPIASLCILGGRLKYVYFFTIGLYLIFERDGLHLIHYLNNYYITVAVHLGYTAAAWILFFILIYNTIILPATQKSAYKSV